MPSQPSTEAPSGLRDHGLLFKRERMESVSRPMLLDSNFRASVRDNDSLYDYGSPGLKLTEHGVSYPRLPAHPIGLHREDARDAERDIVQRSSPGKRQNDDDTNDSPCSVVPVVETSVPQITQVLSNVPLRQPEKNGRNPSSGVGSLLAQACDIVPAQLTDNSPRDKSSDVDPVHVTPPLERSSAVAGTADRDASQCSIPVSFGRDVHQFVGPSQSDANQAEEVRSRDIKSSSISSATIERSSDTEIMPMEQQTLSNLLASLTPQETDIFDDVLESLTSVITNDLLIDEMSDGHRPTEPTPDETDAMLNTWEDLFQNPFEYMLHSLESCPNCGRLIALSRMAPHMVTSCGENRSTETKKKRRKTGIPVRETRSLTTVKKPIPHTASMVDLSQQQSEASSSQTSCSSIGFLETIPSSSKTDLKPDSARMSGLEKEILRLKRRASTEVNPLSAKKVDTDSPEINAGLPPFAIRP